MQNHALIERIKNNGGEKVLQEIYKEYRDEFLKWALWHHNCTMEEAKEVFQQSIVILYEKIVFDKVTEINVQMKTYIFGIGKNKIHELHKRRTRNVGEPDEAMISTFTGIEEENNEGDMKKLEQLESNILQLGEPCKTLLQQYYYHRNSMETIAKNLGYRNADTVKNLKYRCLTRLRMLFLGSESQLTIEKS